MKQDSATCPMLTIGLDPGDKVSRYCRLNAAGDVVEEGRVAMTEEALRTMFEWLARTCGGGDWS